MKPVNEMRYAAFNKALFEWRAVRARTVLSDADDQDELLRVLFFTPAGCGHQVMEKISLLRDLLVENATGGPEYTFPEIPYLACIEADLCRLTIGDGDGS